MAGAFSAVDLSQLPFPDAVETLDFETILEEMIADLQARATAAGISFSALVESDPAYKVLEVAAYRELLIRQRVNDAIKALRLAYAVDADLDHIGARYNVERLLLDPGDDTAVPPVPPTYESNDDYRRRIQLAFEGFSCAGPAGAYIFHALGADADVLDVSVQRPQPGDVLITVLSRTGNGSAGAPLLAAVEAALNDEDVRPLNDTVIVQGATIVNYAIVAELEIYSGPDPAVVLAAAEEAVEKYAAAAHRVGRDVTLSGISAALHQPGVHKVNITSPSAEVAITKSQASWCTAITLTYVVVDE
jgi:phage-related baseplate assembly protein